MEHEAGEASAREILQAGLGELGLPATEIDRLERLAVLLARWAIRLNLTAHRTPESIARRLILDAAALSRVLPGAPIRSIADLGSGAGFPGLPLAILIPDCAVTLVDARERRHHFQRAAIRSLQARNVRAIRGRAETATSEPHQVVVAQAAAQPALALSWMRRWVEPGGWLMIPLAETSSPVEPPPGVFHVETVSYQVPAGGPTRRAWIGQIAS